MKISFASPYLSTQSLPDVDIPAFTLITGINGAGKTHLLQAIANGHLRADVAPNIQNDIRFFDWSTLVPNNAGEFQSSNVYNERDQLIEWSRGQRQTQRQSIQEWAIKYNLTGKLSGGFTSFLRLTREELGRFISDASEADSAWQQMQGFINPAVEAMRQKGRNNPNILAKIDEFKSKLGSGILSLNVTDFEDEPFAWGQVDVFQQSFAQLFMSYFELKKQNLLRRMDETEGRLPTTPSLSDEEFLQRHGIEPWNFVNRLLAEAKLDFEIDYPIEYSTTKFIPQLRKTTSGVDLQFGELSSGERILMSFAICLYYSRDRRQIINRPKLLLLDEIDAPLHPSMSRQLVSTIQNSLVLDQGVNVILTTHSPSTIAVAPEQSIYVMRPNEPGIHKVGKRQAISVLTAEIPTLTIEFSGRRQVFVESQFDAERYEILYRFLSPRISSDRSLTFIATGHKQKSSEQGGGCDNVKRIVEELVASGNNSVFGLIDWDLQNSDSGRVIVMANGTRYAIENCLLDPLLLGALVIRDDRQWAENVGLRSIKGYSDLKNLTNIECQEIIDIIERKVLRLTEDSDFLKRRTVKYVGGNEAQVSVSYLTMKGHDLEDRIKQEFPILRKYHNQGQLLKALIDPIIFDYDAFAPEDIIIAFKKILDFDVNNTS